MTLSKILFRAVIPFFAIASDMALADLDESAGEKLRQTLVSLPLRFEKNTGRFDAQVKYFARGPGYALFLTPGETVLVCKKAKETNQSVVRVRLENANPEATWRGESKLTAPTNYLIGNDPSKWYTADNFERVRAESVYPGIDLVYHGKQNQLEYDFELLPGANSKQIVLRYNGVRSLRVDKDGSLVTQLGDKVELRQHPPVAYQVINGQRHEIASRYVVKGRTTVAFALGDYDTSQPLVIDPPVLTYSSYFGGTVNEFGNAIAVDGNGNAFVTGYTESTNFPTFHAYQGDQGVMDAFVIKVDTNASGAAALMYSTYLGGGGTDVGYGIALGPNGNIFVTGSTQSSDFPVLNGYQTDQPGQDAFVTKLNTNLSGAASLLYSTYLGGNDDDIGWAIAVGNAGNAVVTGQTDSTNFPVLNQYQTNQTGLDAFVTKIDPGAVGAASLLYSTYLGGNDTDIGKAIALDSTGKACVVGYTASTNFPLLNQYQGNQATTDAFVTKIDTGMSGAASLLYSTYLGGSGIDLATGIAVDANDIAYVSGHTFSTDFPTLDEYQSDQGGTDVVVCKMDLSASGAASLLYSTYLGGTGSDDNSAIAVDDNGHVFVTGATDSTDFPRKHALLNDQPSADAFVTELNTNVAGSLALKFSTYLGGDLTEEGYGIAHDSLGNIYVAGHSNSTNFPTLNQYQSNGGLGDAFVTRYGVPAPANETCTGAIAVALDEVVEGTTSGAFNEYQLSGAACFSGVGQTSSTAPGGEVVYSFVAPATDFYSFRISQYSDGGDPVLYVASSCPAAGGSPVTVTTCLGAANRTGAVGAFTSEEVSRLALTAGQQVYIFVDETAPSSGSDFILEVNKAPTETEANNTPATADVPHFGVEGSINPNTDADFYTVLNPGAGARVFSLLDARAANSNEFELRVTTSTDTLEYDHFNTAPPFGDDSATVAGTPLTGVTSYLRVNTAAPAVASEPYRLYTVIQPSGAGLGGSSATPESETNDTIAQADSAANNFFSGALTGPAPSLDKDLFSFAATAGELIFLSLDADPLRNNTPINAKLALLDSTGAVLMQVNDSSIVSSTSSGAGSLTSLTPFSVAESLVYRVAATGTYYARVAIGTTSATTIGAGDYLLSIAKGFQLVSVVSRKTHGGTPFDIPLPLSGEPGIECRSGGGAGNHTLVFTFNNNVASGNPAFSGGVGGITGAPIFVGNTMTLNLTGVLDQQKITISLIGMKDNLSQTLPNTDVSMNVLLGDTTGSKTVNATDVSQTKLQSGNAATATNFRTDVTASGTINATDVSQVKLNSGHGVP